MIHGDLFIILAAVFGFLMAWGVGANDVANAMGTSVGSKALSVMQAIIIAAIFETLGALLAGGQVTQTIRGQIIDVQQFTGSAELLIFGMLASLLAAGTWLIVASSFGWPVSTTHSIVGAVIGFGLVSLGVDAIHWSKTVDIALSWVVTPIIALVIAFLLFRSVQHLIFESSDPIRNAKRYVPWYIFLVALVLSLVTLLNGLKHIGLQLDKWQSVLLAVAISVVVMLIGQWLLRRIVAKQTERVDFVKLEKIFAVLMLFTACAMAFAHGSNDVANAIGPLAAIVGMVEHGGQVLGRSGVPFWIMAIGAIGIVIGLATYGHKVIATIGGDITQLTPSRGFAAQLATASTVVLASGMGLPISTTQTLVGAVLGVGLARGIAALNLAVIRNIFMSWIITLPAGAILAILYYQLIRFFFHFF